MSETNTVLSSNGGNNFDLTWRHGPSTTQVNISTHLFPYVDTTGHDGVNSQLVNTRIVFAPNGRFKQSFGTAVSSRVHSNFPMEIKVTDYLNSRKKIWYASTKKLHRKVTHNIKMPKKYVANKEFAWLYACWVKVDQMPIMFRRILFRVFPLPVWKSHRKLPLLCQWNLERNKSRHLKDEQHYLENVLPFFFQTTEEALQGYVTTFNVTFQRSSLLPG